MLWNAARGGTGTLRRERARLADVLTPDLCVIGAGARRPGRVAEAPGLRRQRRPGRARQAGRRCAQHRGVPCARPWRPPPPTPRPSGTGGGRSALLRTSRAINSRRVHDHSARSSRRMRPSDAEPSLEALGARARQGRGAASPIRAPSASATPRSAPAASSSPPAPGRSSRRSPGLDQVPYFTTETIFDNTRKLTHLVIIGGGPLGARAGAVLSPARHAGDRGRSRRRRSPVPIPSWPRSRCAAARGRRRHPRRIPTLRRPGPQPGHRRLDPHRRRASRCSTSRTSSSPPSARPTSRASTSARPASAAPNPTGAPSTCSAPPPHHQPARLRHRRGRGRRAAVAHLAAIAGPTSWSRAALLGLPVALSSRPHAHASPHRSRDRRSRPDRSRRAPRLGKTSFTVLRASFAENDRARASAPGLRRRQAHRRPRRQNPRRRHCRRPGPGSSRRSSPSPSPTASTREALTGFVAPYPTYAESSRASARNISARRGAAAAAAARLASSG